MSRNRKSAKKSTGPSQRRTSPRAAPRFVGRDASPVLEKYPPKKDPSLTVRGPPAPVTAPPKAPSATPSSPASVSAPIPLIALERPFDVDDFAGLLGETSIRVTVPREDVTEVLRRVSEFMGFGIYVYAISIRPTPGDLLKSFVVELQRVDYDPEKGAWVPFLDKGTSNSPFGPSGTRT